MNLLTRFYDVDSGAIFIDDINIKNMSLADLRGSLSVILQDSFLFSESVRYNLTYGANNCPDENIDKVTSDIKISNLIKRLPKGLESVLWEQGSEISHGQKQLVAIARTMLLDTPILIFDEATGNIDTRTELLIQQAINKITQNRTCFIIAHRLSTVRSADKILVLENGNIVESGKHEELLKLKGVYYRIYNSQFISE